LSPLSPLITHATSSAIVIASFEQQYCEFFDTSAKTCTRSHPVFAAIQDHRADIPCMEHFGRISCEGPESSLFGEHEGSSILTNCSPPPITEALFRAGHRDEAMSNDMLIDMGLPGQARHVMSATISKIRQRKSPAIYISTLHSNVDSQDTSHSLVQPDRICHGVGICIRASLHTNKYTVRLASFSLAARRMHRAPKIERRIQIYDRRFSCAKGPYIRQSLKQETTISRI
jgi:hypothetical protein